MVEKNNVISGILVTSKGGYGVMQGMPEQFHIWELGEALPRIDVFAKLSQFQASAG